MKGKKWIVKVIVETVYTRVVEAESEGEAKLEALAGEAAGGYPGWWTQEAPHIRVEAQ